MTLIGRHLLVERCLADLDERRSVLLVGAEGLGKSAILQAMAARLEDARGVVFTVAGGDGYSGVPLAPFADTLARLGIPGFVPLDAYTRLARELDAASGTLVIDDVDKLDAASKVLVDHVARAGVPVLAAATSVEAVPRAVAEGVDSGAWETHSVGPLDADALVQIAAEHLGAEPSVTAAAALIARAQGSPRVLRALTVAAREGAVRGVGGVELGPRLVTDRSARDWATARAALGPSSVVLVEQLAVAGALPLDVVTDDSLTRLRQHDLVVEASTVSLRSVRLADAVLDSMSDALTARRAGQAADLLEASPAAPRGHAALMAARAGRALSGADAVDAAKSLLARGDARGALAVASATESDADEVLLVTGAALSALERLDEAEEAFARVSPSSDCAVAYGLCQEWGLLLAVRRGDPVGAVERVTVIREGVTDDAHRAVIDGELVKWSLMAGIPGTAPQGLTAEAGADLRVGMALIQAMVASLDGPPEAALSIVENGRRALADSSHPTRHADELLALSEFLATGFDGRLSEAEQAAGRRRQAALIAGDSAVGLWEYASAELTLHAGRYGAAESFARRAVVHLEWRDFTGLRAPAVALYAAVAARLGRAQDAVAALASLPAGASDDIKVVAHVARVTAEQRLQSRDVTDAARILREAGMRAVEEQHRHVGVMALDEAWMVAPTDSAADDVCVHSEAGALAELLSRRVMAVVQKDVDALVAASDDLGALGFAGRSAHGLGVAAALLEANGLTHDARLLRARARAVASFTEASDWPVMGEEEALTAREREIAVLAATRVRSKEVAARLGLSVRTVDNHLGSVFRKLGIQGRDELADALADAEA